MRLATRLVWAVLVFCLAVPVLAQQDVASAPSCQYCGMDRAKFAATRMLVTYEDGTSTGLCSVHCAALDLALSLDKNPKTVQVGDFISKEMIDAETAHWVVVAGKPGVMTSRAKVAFGSAEAAAAFAKENGGTVVAFDEAMKLAYEDMYKDTKMIREKRKMRRAAPAEAPAGAPPAGHAGHAMHKH